ncbi:unnamed protein product, partial [Sphagnum balticum]
HHTKLCVCKMCTCGLHNCPTWPIWPKRNPTLKIIPFNEGFKIGISEAMAEYTPKPIHYPPPDHPKPFRHAHSKDTTYHEHYVEPPMEPPFKIMKDWPTKILFRGESTYTYDYKKTPKCPICPCPPFQSFTTHLDPQGHLMY